MMLISIGKKVRGGIMKCMSQYNMCVCVWGGWMG